MPRIESGDLHRSRMIIAAVFCPRQDLSHANHTSRKYQTNTHMSSNDK